MIVPKSLCEDMKHLVHMGHLSIVKIKEEYQNQQKDEIPIAHDIPTTPWTDLYELKGKSCCSLYYKLF